MKNTILITFVVLVLVASAFIWYKYFYVSKVVVNETPVETVTEKDVVVEKDSVAQDIDTNISDMEEEIDAIDIDKELADFNDLTW